MPLPLGLRLNLGIAKGQGQLFLPLRYRQLYCIVRRRYYRFPGYHVL
jgi:hypothetical protein